MLGVPTSPCMGSRGAASTAGGTRAGGLGGFAARELAYGELDRGESCDVRNGSLAGTGVEAARAPACGVVPKPPPGISDSWRYVVGVPRLYCCQAAEDGGGAGIERSLYIGFRLGG